MESSVIGFIGAGQMAMAILRGVISASLREPKNIVVFDRNAPKLEAVKELGARAAASGKEVASQASVIFVAVKPHAVEGVLQEIRGQLTADKVLVSVAAGVTIETISRHVEAGTQVVRVMPNTPCLVGQGVSAVCAGASAGKESVAAVTRIFAAIGVAVELEERFLDAVTGLSGSGPAFVCVFIEALADGGVRSGLPRDVAMRLAVQLVKGTAALVEQTKLHPGELKDRVTSPGGTTIAGIHALEKGGLRGATIDAVYAATRRSAELGKGIKD